MDNGVDELLRNLLTHASRTRRTAAEGERADQIRDQRSMVRCLVQAFEPLLATTQPRVLERVECDGYTRERVELGFVAGLPFKAYLLIPHGLSAPGPAVIATHGHGYGSRQICGMLPDGSPDPGTTPDGNHHFAVQLVNKGLVVIAPDVLGFGERRSDQDLAFDPEPSSSCYRLAMTLLMHGLTLTGLRSTELLGVVTYLLDRPEVDAERVGIVGFSGGSVLSMITSALDERLAATVLIGFPNTFAASILSVRHCACNYLPGLLNTAEEPDLIGLIAPRPLFVESGREDPIFPAAGFHQALEQLQGGYREARVPDRLAWGLHPGGHEVSGRRSFDWLASTLTGRHLDQDSDIPRA